LESIYNTTTIISIATFALVMVITPGPNNIILLTSGLNFGYKKSLPSIFGVMLGFPLMVILIGLGLGVILSNYPFILDIIKILGMMYLFYLAYKIATSEVDMENNNNKRAFTFIQLVLFQWLNPKAWVIAITTLSIYMQDTQNSFKEVLLIAFIYILMGIISTNTWTLGGVALQNILKNKKHIKIFNQLMAIIIVLSVTPVIIDDYIK
jgi:threonine/homoserine/homoserine lactone efflux protein